MYMCTKGKTKIYLLTLIIQKKKKDKSYDFGFTMLGMGSLTRRLQSTPSKNPGAYPNGRQTDRRSEIPMLLITIIKFYIICHIHVLNIDLQKLGFSLNTNTMGAFTFE